MKRKSSHLMTLTGGLAVSTLLLAGGSARALDAGDLSFYAPFDDSLSAVFAGGKAMPETTVGTYEFTPGMLGQAVITGEPGKELSYAVDNNVPDRKGSLAVWVKLVDWGAPAQNHLILSIPEKLLFYNAANSGGVHLEWPNIGGNTYSYVPSLNKDKFVYIIYTWGDGNVTLYGNGEYCRHVAMNLPPYFYTSLKELPQWTKGLRFYLSNPAMTGDGKNKTVLDELMLFNRPLDATEVKNLYRHMTAPLLETIASIGEIANAPKLDGAFSPAEWNQTAQLADFTDRPFGNLSSKPLKANIGYDQKALYIALRSPKGKSGTPQDDKLEIQILPKDAKEPCRFVATADRKLSVFRGAEKAKEEILWQAAVSSSDGKDEAESCFEVAIPWSSLGLTAVPEGTALKMNILRHWSADYRDVASWCDVAPAGISTNPTACYGTIILGGKSPVLAMESLGRLNYAQLELAGKIISPSGTDQAVKAEVRLQPSDLKEYYDPKTLPGTKSYTGTQVILDRDMKMPDGSGDLSVTESFSDTDINSLWLKVSDPAGKIIYQAQRTFVAEPPIVADVKTYPGHDRLEVSVDVSRYRESPLKDLRAEIELTSSSGKVVKTARIAKFESVKQTINLPLTPLPVGKIAVKATLLKGQGRIASFVTSFEKLGRLPWQGNNLGKDDVVIPPFTPVKVEGQSVSVWGRTYRWGNSLFPVQITSVGEDLLARPMELVTGGVSTGKSNPAKVKIKKRTKTRAVVECTGTIGGVSVTAHHTIEYDGMCLTQLQLNPAGESRIEGLALSIPYIKEQSTLYVLWPDIAAGAVAEKINPGVPPMNGNRTFGFENMVWLGNEDRGMTWFAEAPAGWKLKGNAPPLTVQTEADATSLTVRFAEKPFSINKSLSLTFGTIATPTKPMQDGWRFTRQGRSWTYDWAGALTVAQNDIGNVLPLYKYGMDKWKLIGPKFKPSYDDDKPLSFTLPYLFPPLLCTTQPECSYYGEEWLTPPRSTCGCDNGAPIRQLFVCMNSEFQDFEVYHTVKAFNDQTLDGYYFDGGGPGLCKNTLHGDGWIDEDGVVQPRYGILAQREFFKRLAVEFSKAGRPYTVFANINPCVVLPCFSFMQMGWNGEQFSGTAMPAGDYNKLMTLPYFRAQFLGQQFGMIIQWLVMYPDSSMGRKAIDSVLELALVHGVGDLCLASALGAPENGPYIRSVLNAQDDFGVQRRDCTFLPYWKNAKQVTVEPADENLVCSIWQRPGKVLLVLANSTKDDQQASVHLNLSALELKGTLKASDLISKETQVIEGGVITAKVARSNWRLLVVEDTSAGVPAAEQPEDFFHAVQKGELAQATAYLAADGKLIKAKDKEGYTALHFAAFNNRREMAALLLEKGAEVNARCQLGFTPLHLAANDCYQDVVELLIAKGADINARNNKGIRPLHLAVSVPITSRVAPGYTETVTLLLQKGADVNARDDFDRTPLHWLVNWHPCWAEKAMGELLIKNGADVNAREKRGWTPLRYASTPQYFKDAMHPELAEVLRNHGGQE